MCKLWTWLKSFFVKETSDKDSRDQAVSNDLSLEQAYNRLGISSQYDNEKKIFENQQRNGNDTSGRGEQLKKK